jgi:transposase
MEAVTCKDDYAENVKEKMLAPSALQRASFLFNADSDNKIIRNLLTPARGQEIISIIILTEWKMPKQKPDPTKLDSLRRQGCLNLHPELVTDPLFREREFFDANDLVQIKYEMLRRVEVDNLTVSQAAFTFGLSRPTFYQARFDFEQGGLPGLIPRKPGPRTAHKFTPEIVDFIRGEQQANLSLRASELVTLVRERFGITVHPNSIDRALRRQEKKQS